jgi:P27 family predicted phage terminase small subunit
MTRRGRKPAPTPLKILKGTRKDRINTQAPRPPVARPDPPETLDSFGMAEWNRILPQLEELGILARVDGAALALYCSAYSQWQRAEVEIAMYGVLVDSSGGGLKANPAIGVASTARAQMHSLLSEFGATPASRGKVKATADDAKARDALGEFLKRRANAKPSS